MGCVRRLGRTVFGLLLLGLTVINNQVQQWRHGPKRFRHLLALESERGRRATSFCSGHLLRESLYILGRTGVAVMPSSGLCIEALQG